MTISTNSAKEISRRDLLAAGLFGSAALATGALAGCGPSPSAPSNTSAVSTKPKRGGNLRVTLLGGGSADTLDAQKWVTYPDIARSCALYDPLVRCDALDGPQLWLAEEISPYKNSAKAWIVRVRSGVEFHNGKEVTADDVLYSFQRVLNPKNPLEGDTALAAVDVASARKLDKYTVLFPMMFGYSSFVSQLYSSYASNIIPVGYDPSHPVGSGPFKLESFTPGVQSVFARNENYWLSPEPYVDTLTIIDGSDTASQINAMLASDTDAIGNIEPAAVAELLGRGGIKVLNAKTSAYTPITMRVDVAPFNDVRVRQAMRLLVDRQEIVDTAFDGYAVVGNDLFGVSDPDYDHSLVRHQDVGQAKHLLKAAGHENLTTTLVTSPVANGLVTSAEVFAQQAKAAGVNVLIQNVPYSTFFNSEYLQRPFSQDFWFPGFYLAMVAQETLKGAPYNETHWNNDEYASLYYQANATLDPNLIREIIHRMQEIDFNEGGLIIPTFNNNVDAYTAKLEGFQSYASAIPFGGCHFESVWFTA
jgi:peptide/nickel transport system substrate-binding protein